MPTSSASWFGDFVEPIAVVVTLLLSIPIFWTWWEVTIGRRRRHRIWLRERRREVGNAPSILIVDIPRDSAGRDVNVQVERFRKDNADLAAIPPDRIFRIARDRGMKPDDMADFQRQLRKTGNEVYAAGTDVLHYFHQGPLPTAAMVGVEFSNACQVNFYHWVQTTYQPWGPINHTPER